MKAGELQRPNSLLCFFRMSRDFDSAQEMLKWRSVCSHIFQIARFLLSLYRRSNNYIFKVCQKVYSLVMLGVNCSVYDCGSCRRTTGIGIFKVPLAKDDAHKRWRDQWLGEIKKTREMDQDFRRQINDDKIYACEKQYRFMNSSTIT